MRFSALSSRVVCAWILCAGLLGAQGLSAKPFAPINVWIEPVTAMVAGQVAEFEVRVICALDTEQLSIAVQAPPGMVLHQGSLTWQGAARRDETISLRFSATLPAYGDQSIAVQALIQQPGANPLSAMAV